MSSQDNESAPAKKRRLPQYIFLTLAAGIGAATSIAVLQSGYTISAPAKDVAALAAAASVVPAKIDWLAAAPGRIEPRTGLVRNKGLKSRGTSIRPKGLTSPSATRFSASAARHGCGAVECFKTR